MLALAAPDVVSTDRLVDGLWADEPPSNPLGTLQVYVHGVRKALREVSEVELVERVPPPPTDWLSVTRSLPAPVSRPCGAPPATAPCGEGRARPPRRWRRPSGS